MVVQADHLVAEIGESEVLDLLAVDAAVALDLGQAAVVLPLPLAAEAHKGHHAQLVTQVINRVVLAPDILEADEVHVHVHHIAHLLFDAFRRVAEEDVIRPAAALDEDVLAVQGHLTVAVRGEAALDLADAEGGLLAVGNRAGFLHGDRECIQFRLAEIPAPPYTRILDAQDAGLGGCQDELLQVSGSEGHRHADRVSPEVQDDLRVDGTVLRIPQAHAHAKIGSLEGLHIQVRNDVHVLDGNGACGVQGDRTDDAHRLVQRTGVPVHEADVQVALLRAAQLDFQLVAAFQLARHVIGAADEDAEGRVRGGELFPVQEDVCIIIQAVEHEFGVLALARLPGKDGGIGPGIVKDRLVHFLVIARLQQAFAEVSGVGQGARHRGRRLGGEFVGRALAGKGPSLGEDLAVPGRDRILRAARCHGHGKEENQFFHIIAGMLRGPECYRRYRCRW